MSRHFQFRRKSLSGNWKTNIGQSLLEEVPVSGHHKAWIDEVINGIVNIKQYLIRFLGVYDVWWPGYLLFRGRSRKR